MLDAIVSALIGYLSGVWTVIRIAFSALDVPLMTNCLHLLAVVALIGIVDNLPAIFNRKKKKDEEDEYEWVRVRKNK